MRWNYLSDGMLSTLRTQTVSLGSVSLNMALYDQHFNGSYSVGVSYLMTCSIHCCLPCCLYVFSICRVEYWVPLFAVSMGTTWGVCAACCIPSVGQVWHQLITDMSPRIATMYFYFCFWTMLAYSDVNEQKDKWLFYDLSISLIHIRIFIHSFLKLSSHSEDWQSNMDI